VDEFLGEDGRLQKNEDFNFGLDQKILDRKGNERLILSFLFIALYWSLGALGRDVFVDSTLRGAIEEDPISKVLPYIRWLTCILAVLVVTASAGFTWAMGRVPLMLAPFCTFALLSALWAEDSKTAFKGGLTLFMVWIAMTMIIHRLGVVRVVRLSLYVLMAVCIISFLLAVFVPSIGRHTGMEVTEQAHAGRWRGIFAHKNSLGPWVAYGSVFFFTHGRFMNVNAALLWLARISAVSCLLFSGSATALILAVVVFGGWLALMALRKYPPQLVVFGAIATTVIGGLMAYFFLDLLFDAVGRDATFTGRTQIWEAALQFLPSRFWLGAGYQSFGGEDFLQHEVAVFGEGIPGAESGYLTLLLELGVIGFTLFFIPFFMALRNGLEWLKYVQIEDREAIEFLILILGSSLIEAITESNSLVATGYDGVMAYTALFVLLTTPKSPTSIRRSDYKLAKHWLPQASSGGSASDAAARRAIG